MKSGQCSLRRDVLHSTKLEKLKSVALNYTLITKVWLLTATKGSAVIRKIAFNMYDFGLYSSVDAGSGLQRYTAMWVGIQAPLFSRCLPPSSSGLSRLRGVFWRWRQQILPEFWYLYTNPHGL
jgi:hypothetical protein